MSRLPKVDLNMYPAEQVVITAEAGKTCVLTLGDLHASFKKLAYTLSVFGFWRPTEAQYYRLLRISEKFSHGYFYERGNKAAIRQSLAEFTDILNQITFDAKAGFLLRFIGDVFADRGPNDWLLLLVFHKMAEAGAQFVFTFGNHDIDFVAFVEGRRQRTVSTRQTPSLQHLSLLIERGIITMCQVREMYNLVVAQRWELWGCDMNGPDKGTLSVHAAAQVSALFHAAREFGVDIPADMGAINRVQLYHIIQKTNVKFREYAGTHRLLATGNPVSITRMLTGLARVRRQGGADSTQIIVDSPFVHCAWNRVLSRTELTQTQAFLKRLGLVVLIGHVGQRPAVPVIDGDEGEDAGQFYRILDTDTGKNESCMCGPILFGITRGRVHGGRPDEFVQCLPSNMGAVKQQALQKTVCELANHWVGPIMRELPESEKSRSVCGALNQCLAIVGSLAASGGNFADHWQQAMGGLQRALCVDRNKSLRVFKAVVVNSLLCLACVLTLFIAVVAFTERKKRTGCPWFYGQAKSADRFFAVRSDFTEAVSRRCGFTTGSDSR